MGWIAVLATSASTPVPEAAGHVLLASVNDPLAFGDAMTHAAQQHGTDSVVLAVPEGLARTAAVAVTMTGVRAPELRIAPFTSPHVPLVLHAGLSVASGHIGEPALAHGFLEAYTSRSWSGSWMPSVAALSSPAPSLTQQLRSLLPGKGFLVSMAPLRAIGRDTVPRGDDADIRRTLLVSDAAALPQGLTESIAVQAAISEVIPYPLPNAWPGLLGHRRAAQLALVATDPLSVWFSVNSWCPGCGERLTGHICPFCCIHGRSPDAVAPGEIA